MMDIMECRLIATGTNLAPSKKIVNHIGLFPMVSDQPTGRANGQAFARIM